MTGGFPELRSSIFLSKKFLSECFSQLAYAILIGCPGANMKDRTHFEHRLDMYGSGDEVVEHLAGIEDYFSPSRPITPRAGAGRMLI
jgi:hypothetical protein